MPEYRRVLLKLSGEALAGSAGFGLDQTTLARVCGEIAEIRALGVSVGIVVGGGNFFRGVKAADAGLHRITVDSMGMLATAINALALADFLRAAGAEAEVLSAVAMEPLVSRFERRRALSLLDSGAVLVFAAGTGNPLFSTDTAAALRAIEIEADVLAKATKVDGVYDKDPEAHSDARRFKRVSYDEVLRERLAVMDAAAVSLCREHELPVLVFNLNVSGNIRRAVEGEDVGTLMYRGE